MNLQKNRGVVDYMYLQLNAKVLKSSIYCYIEFQKAYYATNGSRKIILICGKHFDYSLSEGFADKTLVEWIRLRGV